MKYHQIQFIHNPKDWNSQRKKKKTLFINPQEPNSQKFTIEWDDSLVSHKKNRLLTPNCPKKKVHSLSIIKYNFSKGFISMFLFICILFSYKLNIIFQKVLFPCFYLFM